MLRLEGLAKTYDGGRVHAVRGVDLHVEAGELVALVGESGCGKTTTLKMINRLVEPSAGRVIVGGADADAIDPIVLRRRIGYVFQGVGLFPHLSVAENVATVPRLLGWSARDRRERVRSMLELVRLDPAKFAARRPAELSGGQRQRVGVARALAGEPEIVLMDEPFGALDPATRGRLQEEFRDLQRRLRLTVVLVTHDMTEALLLADRVAVMHEGRLVALDTPRDLLRDGKNPIVRTLVQTPLRQAGRVRSLAVETAP